MLAYIVLFVSLLFCTLLAILVMVIHRTHDREIHDLHGMRMEQTKLLQEEVTNLRNQNKDLLNRLMSKDIQAYSVMTTLPSSSTPSFNDPYISQSDEAEVARLEQFQKSYAVQGQGVGEAIYDDELRGTLNELGITDFNDSEFDKSRSE